MYIPISNTTANFGVKYFTKNYMQEQLYNISFDHQNGTTTVYFHFKTKGKQYLREE